MFFAQSSEVPCISHDWWDWHVWTYSYSYMLEVNSSILLFFKDNKTCVYLITLTHWALQRWRAFFPCTPELIRKCMNFGRPETPLGEEDWKTHDVCGRHQEPTSWKLMKWNCNLSHSGTSNFLNFLGEHASYPPPSIFCTKLQAFFKQKSHS